MSTSPKTINSLGLEIDFPFQPYGVQRVIMNKLTLTFINKENSLIESPTGTGKTLALLCSSLAYQKRSKALGKPFMSEKLTKALMAERRAILIKRPCTCGKRLNRSELDEYRDLANRVVKNIPLGTINVRREDYIDLDFGDEESLGADHKRLRTDSGFIDHQEPAHCSSTQNFNLTTRNYDLTPGTSSSNTNGDNIRSNMAQNIYKRIPTPESSQAQTLAGRKVCIHCRMIEAGDNYEKVLNEDDIDPETLRLTKPRIPKIYYGTRTHKQITQVIRELNKTSYKKQLRMCILSSRERSCINESIKDLADRNHLCLEKVKNYKKSSQHERNQNNSERLCYFYGGSSRCAENFEDIHVEFEERAWDIEDAVEFGKRKFTCPYYGTKSLQKHADITFSPYNYLLDPFIRETMNINLKNAIIIFDEAHNIEDICRDNASFEIDTKQIDDILFTITTLLKHSSRSSMTDAFVFFKDIFQKLKRYLVYYVFPYSPYEEGSEFVSRKKLNIGELINDLISLGLGPGNMMRLKESLNALKDDESDRSDDSSMGSQQPVINLQVFSQLYIALNFMYGQNSKNLDDFRGVITKYHKQDLYQLSHQQNNSQQIIQYDPHSYDSHTWRFSLLCMNPSLAFEEIHRLAWSVIVTSGTLSPIESYKTELGCEFPNIFQGPHIIQDEQLFATIVARGPNNIDLNCGAKHIDYLSEEFQNDLFNEVGFIVQDICKTVPNGVLCFFPGHERLDEFCQHWSDNGTFNSIRATGKDIFREDRLMPASDFEDKLKRYNERAVSSGALWLGVVRGRVSEGIDFADKSARAVITIGIPYPNLGETTIQLKREYNDIYSSFSQLMTGCDWYSCQAFRPLNQALGRCIRHKQDWGSIIMIESRMRSIGHLNRLSKWLARGIQINDYSTMLSKLRQHVQKRTSGIANEESTFLAIQ